MKTFVAFIALFFGGHTLSGDLAGLDAKPNVIGYVPGDTLGNTQFVFVDTPGFQTLHANALNKSLNKAVFCNSSVKLI